MSVEIHDKTAEVVKTIRRLAEAMIQELAEEMAVQAGEIVVPSDKYPSLAKDPKKQATGNLSRSIRPERKGNLEWQVQTETGYGGFVELGTSKMAARPFLAPAFDQAFDAVVKRGGKMA